MKKRLIALFLALCMLLSFGTGCSPAALLQAARMVMSLQEEKKPAVEVPSSSTSSQAEESSSSVVEEEEEESSAVEVPALRDYFADDVWRADLHFDEMTYEHYELDAFEAVAEEMLLVMEEDPTVDNFYTVDSDLVWELYYIYTLYTIIELEYMADLNDTWAAEEYAYTEEVWYEAYDIYWETLGIVAKEHPDAMVDSYADWQIEWFAEYEPGDGSENELYLMESDLLQVYYELIAEPAPDVDALCDLFVELVAVRNDIAAYYGYDNYADYAYENLYYKAYTPEDSQLIWQATKDYFVPVLTSYEAFAPGNVTGLDCSPEAVLSAMNEHLPELSPEVYEAFRYMIENELYDIAPSDTKAETGYTVSLYVANEPFIFNCPYGNWYDYTDMFHEFGHFLNSYYVPSDLVFGAPDNDLCELQSQGMEIMFTQWYPEIFGESNANAVLYDLLCNMMYSVQQGAMYDEFQQRVYAEENLTSDKVLDIYREVYLEYGNAPYAGYEYEWAYVTHNFEYPFYYISYCVSAIPALELYAMLQEDVDAAEDIYLTVAAMDPEWYYFSDAVEEAGLREVFSEETFAHTAAAVAETLALLANKGTLV